MRNNNNDIDAIETSEWLAALDSVIAREGTARAEFLLSELIEHAANKSVDIVSSTSSPYRNTIDVANEIDTPIDYTIEKNIRAYIRWNALAMVLRAGKYASELGGHIASYASAAVLYEIGFNHFFKAKTDNYLGDLVFIQGHSAPGIYARAFLEGRLSEQHLDNFRQEVDGPGLSSYPHPWLMRDFWQLPTVSMGLGPLQAVYQARFDKYMHGRGFLETNRKVWAFLGDGEVDEPESLCAISLAARENLDNLIFVINCNLQRLDGPVRGNSKIIQELEGLFKGANWNVIKLIWGDKWDKLFAKDKLGILQKRMEECVDGDYQAYKGKDGKYVREHFFGAYPELLEMVKDYSDEEIWSLNRGGHDPKKVYNAYHRAVNSTGGPTVILAKTVKGFGMGSAGEGQNITHNKKKMSVDEIKEFRDRFNLPIADDKLEDIPFYAPDKDSPEIKYLLKRRQELGGFLPERKFVPKVLPVPGLDDFATLLGDTQDRNISTTMAAVRALSIMLKDKEIGRRVVPITPDESRTFGMEGLFRQYGIYSSVGQLYTPEDSQQLMFYKESKSGQILEDGLTEAGAFSSWLAAGTSYSFRDEPMIPVYIFYSMFGFQRIGDLIWAASDILARGFLFGATSGRTTLAGEGLQHNDGHSHVMSSLVPNCISYDPAFSYELAVIIQHGLERMYAKQENVFYYITIMNENYHHPAMPEGANDGIIKGMYLYQEADNADINMLGSGTILLEVIKAANILKEKFAINANIWSVTSFTELKRNANDVERYNRLHPLEEHKTSYAAECFKQNIPVVAATDYVRSYADQIRSEISTDYLVLGTDGFGRSDTRKRLREFFEVDANSIVVASLTVLMRQGKVTKQVVADAIQEFGIDKEAIEPYYL